ncbi:MAG: hypothetical protein R2742_03910 [Micropruina glycogenica]
MPGSTGSTTTCSRPSWLLAIVLCGWRATAAGARKKQAREQLYNLVRNGIARDILGHDYQRFLPFLLVCSASF